MHVGIDSRFPSTPLTMVVFTVIPAINGTTHVPLLSAIVVDVFGVGVLVASLPTRILIEGIGWSTGKLICSTLSYCMDAHITGDGDKTVRRPSLEIFRNAS